MSAIDSRSTREKTEDENREVDLEEKEDLPDSNYHL